MPLTFRDDQQRSRVAGTLCRQVGLQHVWADDGPTDFCLQLMAAARAELQPHERIVLYLALAVWGDLQGWPREAAVAVEELLALDPASLETVGELLASAQEGADGIDWWLRSHG